MARADRAIRAATLPSGFRPLTLKLVYANVGQEPTIRSFRPKQTFCTQRLRVGPTREEDGNGN